MITFELNGKSVQTDADATMPLLWFLRDEVAMTGTKYGCGMSLCGACTVHVDGQPTRACVTPLSALSGKKVTTIEGARGKVVDAVRHAWLEHNVVQCGYCQSGQIMAAAALLEANAKPSDADIDQAMSGNICRCATYFRIRKAIHAAAKALG